MAAERGGRGKEGDEMGFGIFFLWYLEVALDCSFDFSFSFIVLSYILMFLMLYIFI